jgi:2-hydroxychromene-2-carboxylate isomerase
MAQPTFFYDLGSPFAYLASERIDDLFEEPVAWQPVSLGAIFKLTGRSSWAVGDERRREAGVADVEERARRYGLPPVRWPDPWPSNYLMAMRAATHAQRLGREREFARAAFRHAFAEGHDIAQPENVLEAAAKAGLDPAEVEAATQDPEVKQLLREATDRARELGVFGVPTVALDGELFWGDDRLDEAAARSVAATS